ncbi:hypothetical protein B1207_11670 [Legionella quinlivanii]|uniref:Uncharacterized protein n=1 Tax=Legionella quinlivanii TaxID=45073 RepID=A0A364LHF6_9GAMM|nr:hypothetical protein [Legionella quinlivanii]RAP35734.1 hypothetical protein B1207_11670 [Legionella quinlivanii]
MSGTISREIAELCLDNIQEKGLALFKHKSYDLDHWNPNDVFGYDFNRNQFYKKALNDLAPKIEKGFKKAGIYLSNSSLNMQEFIAYNLTHCILSRLLNPDAEVVISYDEIKKDKLGISYQLPAYEPLKIESFTQKGLAIEPSVSASLMLEDSHKKSKKKKMLPAPTPQVSNAVAEQQISFATTDSHEKSLISAILAAKICILINQIDVESLVQGALVHQKNQRKADKLAKQGLFAQAGAAALLPGQKPYTEEEQEKDTLKVIKEDVSKIPAKKLSSIAQGKLPAVEEEDLELDNLSKSISRF